MIKSKNYGLPRVFVFLFLAVLCVPAETQYTDSAPRLKKIVSKWFDEGLMLYVGEVRVIRVPQVKRVAVGNGKLLSTSITKSGQLILLAEGKGDTGLHIWNTDGTETDIQVSIRASNPMRMMRELKTLVLGLKGISVREVGGRPVVEGLLDPKYVPVLEALMKAYPTILNLTRLSKLSHEKMVYMNVKITEFNTGDLQNLGIKWSSPIIGPQAAFAIERPLKGSAVNIKGGTETPGIFKDVTTQNNFITAAGFFGIATQLTSRINYLVNNNHALILAEPRLSAKSGGEASFLAGGEIPIKSSSQLGENVEFKEFGIKLNIKPVVDEDNNVIARVETEVSSVDELASVGGVPGFRVRKTATDISMRDGDTLVISGLVDRQLSNVVEKVKWLGDIPILGHLFKSTDFKDRRSELVIFVTPTVFDANSDINRAERKRQEQMLSGFLKGSKRKLIID